MSDFLDSHFQRIAKVGSQYCFWNIARSFAPPDGPLYFARTFPLELCSRTPERPGRSGGRHGFLNDAQRLQTPKHSMYAIFADQLGWCQGGSVWGGSPSWQSHGVSGTGRFEQPSLKASSTQASSPQTARSFSTPNSGESVGGRRAASRLARRSVAAWMQQLL